MAEKPRQHQPAATDPTRPQQASQEPTPATAEASLAPVVREKPKPAPIPVRRDREPDRVEALARDLFIQTATNAQSTSRTLESLAARSFELAEAFYAVADQK